MSGYPDAETAAQVLSETPVVTKTANRRVIVADITYTSYLSKLHESIRYEELMDEDNDAETTNRYYFIVDNFQTLMKSKPFAGFIRVLRSLGFLHPCEKGPTSRAMSLKKLVENERVRDTSPITFFIITNSVMLFNVATTLQRKHAKLNFVFLSDNPQPNKAKARHTTLDINTVYPEFITKKEST